MITAFALIGGASVILTDPIFQGMAISLMFGVFVSTVLTLLVIPVGFVFLNRLDRLFGRLGPWIVIAWAGATAAVIEAHDLTRIWGTGAAAQLGIDMNLISGTAGHA